MLKIDLGVRHISSHAFVTQAWVGSGQGQLKILKGIFTWRGQHWGELWTQRWTQKDGKMMPETHSPPSKFLSLDESNQKPEGKEKFWFSLHGSVSQGIEEDRDWWKMDLKSLKGRTCTYILYRCYNISKPSSSLKSIAQYNVQYNSAYFDRPIVQISIYG